MARNKANIAPSGSVGIFDSGMGGLTVAHAVTQLLPAEDIVYFGDTAHTPWGDKSVSAIQSYSIKICEVLLQHKCKVIVMACHTASAAAYEVVKEYVGERATVINVIDPVIAHIEQHCVGQKMALIGTKQTIRSNTYKKRVDELGKSIELRSLATPLLVPLIEEGFLNKPVTEAIVCEYLSNPNLQDIDSIILGCTHYPLIKAHILNYHKHKVSVIDAAELVSQALKSFLEKQQLLKITKNPAKRLFYISDYNEFFANTAKLFFSEDVHLEAYPLWD